MRKGTGIVLPFLNIICQNTKRGHKVAAYIECYAVGHMEGNLYILFETKV